MVPANRKSSGLSDAPQELAFGPAIWVWGLLIGVALWVAGFVLLPWWMALLVWWWPSIITGATISLATIAAAQVIAQQTRRAQDREAAAPSGSAAVVSHPSIARPKFRLKEQSRRRRPNPAGRGRIKDAAAASHLTREADL